MQNNFNFFELCLILQLNGLQKLLWTRCVFAWWRKIKYFITDGCRFASFV